MAPVHDPTHVMIWREPTSGAWQFRDAENIDLLALKIVVEEIDPRAAAKAGKTDLGRVQGAIDRAIAHGLLLSPESGIRRVRQDGTPPDPAFLSFASADRFTLQWHLTQACDLHCRHCYDRSDRHTVSPETALRILEDFYAFCRRMHVRGQVTFTGGNPLLYPRFETVYRNAARLGFGIAILGNPTPRRRIERLLEIARPLFFQISLEGLAAHNDAVRGKGHFAKSLAFLKVLHDLDIASMVMLTLTRDNVDQVLPLAETLKDLTDHFTFNRLSAVGEGAGLLMPEKKTFPAFLKAYAQAAADNPKMGFKDNLFNLIRQKEGAAPIGGCTGYGCGAAFNFLALLADGEVHACRKFPSRIGDIHEDTLYDIYHTDLAARYRAGSLACRDCRLNTVCRGCLAVAHSAGLNVFTDKDPFCYASS
jgi:selenobiotic family peptide radical SAM maturase